MFEGLDGARRAQKRLVLGLGRVLRGGVPGADGLVEDGLDQPHPGLPAQGEREAQVGGKAVLAGELVEGRVDRVDDIPQVHGAGLLGVAAVQRHRREEPAPGLADLRIRPLLGGPGLLEAEVGPERLGDHAV